MKMNPVPGFTAQLDRLEYVPTSSAPTHRPHQFAYYITLLNQSVHRLKILRRKWVITNRHRHKLIIEGDGVVGEFPILSPGDRFHYNSYHLIDSTSTAEGVYLAEDDEGAIVAAKLPPFIMNLPYECGGTFD